MFSETLHRYIFLIGIIGLATGMLFGTAPTSIPQIILAANWALEGNFLYKWERLKTNKIFLLLISFYFLHIMGMLYTEQTQAGLDDLRNKLPLFILPLLFFSSKPLSGKEFKAVFLFFFSAVLISSFCCYLVYAGYTHKTIVDVRQASIFMSHIRFSLFIAFAVTGLFYYLFHEKKLMLQLICFGCSCWLLFFMYRLEMATGFVCLLMVAGILCVFYSIRRFSTIVSAGVLTVLTVVVLIPINYAYRSLNMYDVVKNNISNTLLKTTLNGRPYLQDTVFKQAENGNLITVNINDVELERSWESKSSIPYHGKDKKGNALRFTVLRYLASKGLTKDSLGMQSLAPRDIENIEKGISNYQYANHPGLVTRWREIVWEYTKYKRGENPSGHTLIMRLEFWNTACYIIKHHLVFGVGTGDIQLSFNNAYKETHSKLDNEWRLRCHNQYLATGVAFGLVGLLFFSVYLFYPAIVLRKKIHPLYLPFFLIALLSFFTEDTLETQSGVTFFIFFQTLFLWLASCKETKGIEKTI